MLKTLTIAELINFKTYLPETTLAGTWCQTPVPSMGQGSDPMSQLFVIYNACPLEKKLSLLRLALNGL